MINSTSKNKTRAHSTSSGQATSMAQLLASQKGSSFITPHKGEALTGTITKLTSSEILIDINAKTEAVVLEKDRGILQKILSSLKVGDKVQVTVLNPESDMGNSVVSLRRFIDDIMWAKLSELQKSQKAVEVRINSLTKGGFLVSTLDGISGFLPNSHISTLENQEGMVGKTIKSILLEVNRPLRKIIFSQKQVLGVSDFQKLIKNLKIGQEIETVITNVAPFGIFVSVPLGESNFAEGFIHISEASWDNISDLSGSFEIGQSIKAIITGADKEQRRVNLSIKRLTTDPFEKELERFKVDDKVRGTVLKTISTGILVNLDNGISGLIKKDKVPPKTIYKEGDEINLVISRIDKKKHKVLVLPVLLEKPIGYR